MTHVITSLCLRDNGCSDVCPVECIQPGTPLEEWPTYYIDSSVCIDCGACVPECPFHAIYPEDEVPAAYKAKGGEVFNQLGFSESYTAQSHHGETVNLKSTRVLVAGETVDLRTAIEANKKYFK